MSIRKRPHRSISTLVWSLFLLSPLEDVTQQLFFIQSLSEGFFRRIFFLAVYVAIVLLITLLNREIWENPLSDVLGTWGLYNKKGKLTTEVIENLLMFVPFPVLMFVAFRDKLLKSMKLHDILWTSIRISFLFSAGIEVAQLLFRLGTFQLSDLFYNTLGGILGGLCYFIGYKLKKGNKQKTEKPDKLDV